MKPKTVVFYDYKNNIVLDCFYYDDNNEYDKNLTTKEINETYQGRIQEGYKFTQMEFDEDYYYLWLNNEDKLANICKHVYVTLNKKVKENNSMLISYIEYNPAAVNPIGCCACNAEPDVISTEDTKNRVEAVLKFHKDKFPINYQEVCLIALEDIDWRDYTIPELTELCKKELKRMKEEQEESKQHKGCRREIIIQNDDGSYRTTYEVLSDLWEIWCCMSDEQRSGVTKDLIDKIADTVKRTVNPWS